MATFEVPVALLGSTTVSREEWIEPNIYYSGGKYMARVSVNHQQRSRTFPTLEQARGWARKQEASRKPPPRPSRHPAQPRVVSLEPGISRLKYGNALTGGYRVRRQQDHVRVTRTFPTIEEARVFPGRSLTRLVRGGLPRKELEQAAMLELEGTPA